MSHWYTIIGLTLRSDIELPEATPHPGEANSDDIRITREGFDYDKGAARAITHRSYIDRRGDYLLEIEDVAKFKISDARRISVDPVGGAAWPEIRAYLFGTVLTALCYMRGLVPLHGSCVAEGGSAIAMIGASGAGKSTLAACLGRQGWSVISDDTCAIDLSTTNPIVLPTVSRIKLWPESVRIAELDNSHSGGSDAQGKFHFYRVDNTEACTSPTPLAAIFVLEPLLYGNESTVRLIQDPKDAIGLLLSNLPRKRILQALELDKPIIGAVATIAARVPVFSLQRPDDAGVHDLTALVRSALEKAL